VLEATSDDVHKYIFWLFENKEQKVNKVEWDKRVWREKNEEIKRSVRIISCLALMTGNVFRFYHLCECSCLFFPVLIRVNGRKHGHCTHFSSFDFRNFDFRPIWKHCHPFELEECGKEENLEQKKRYRC
jgi:hypothetical protein